MLVTARTRAKENRNAAVRLQRSSASIASKRCHSSSSCSAVNCFPNCLFKETPSSALVTDPSCSWYRSSCAQQPRPKLENRSKTLPHVSDQWQQHSTEKEAGIQEYSIISGQLTSATEDHTAQKGQRVVES